MDHDNDLSVRQLQMLVMKQAEAKGFGTKPEDVSFPKNCSYSLGSLGGV